MNIPDHISESKTIFWVKILKFFGADPEPGIFFDPGSGIRDGKTSDRDKQPGSATLAVCESTTKE
jgi:hypothetical protein